LVFNGTSTQIRNFLQISKEKKPAQADDHHTHSKTLPKHKCNNRLPHGITHLLNHRSNDGRGYHPLCFSNAIFQREFLRNASVHLRVTHFHIFWCTNFKTILLPRKYVKITVKVLAGCYHLPYISPISPLYLSSSTGTKFQQLTRYFRGKESNGTIGNTLQRNQKS